MRTHQQIYDRQQELKDEMTAAIQRAKESLGAEWEAEREVLRNECEQIGHVFAKCHPLFLTVSAPICVICGRQKRDANPIESATARPPEEQAEV